MVEVSKNKKQWFISYFVVLIIQFILEKYIKYNFRDELNSINWGLTNLLFLIYVFFSPFLMNYLYENRKNIFYIFFLINVVVFLCLLVIILKLSL